MLRSYQTYSQHPKPIKLSLKNFTIPTPWVLLSHVAPYNPCSFVGVISVQYKCMDSFNIIYKELIRNRGTYGEAQSLF